MINVLMIGAGRKVKGGVSTVVNQYYEVGLDKKINLKYIATMRDGSKVKKLLVCLKSFYVFCKSLKHYEIVHVHMSHRASFYRKSIFIKKAFKAGKKIIIHLHGSEFDVFYHEECDAKQKEKVRQIFGIANVVIVLSEEWKTKVSEFCDASKILIIHNSVKLPDFIRNDYSDNNVLFLGRLGKRKGSYDLIKVIPGVIAHIPNVHFYLGGDGEVNETIEMIQKLGIDKNVSYIGWITGEKKVEMLKKCSTFVLPSYHEGMPMAILEAMSYGEAVISTSVGGIPQIIMNGCNGILVEPGDIVKLEKGLIAVLETDKERIGQNGYKTIVASFNAEQNINTLIDLYRTI